ncbi:MAG: hypothetical protein KDC98_02360, partial [Planctomycetes bacterium]|nr:hypothetical protein [Planctomycetota bacterium]
MAGIRLESWRTAAIAMVAAMTLAAAARTQQPPATLALLIGIDQYRQPGTGQVPALKGAINDV